MLVKGNLSRTEANCIQKIKEMMYGENSVHIHNAYVISQLLIERRYSYEEVCKTVRLSRLDTSADRTVNTTFRLNQKAYEILEEYITHTKCSKIAVIRALILLSTPQK